MSSVTRDANDRLEHGDGGRGAGVRGRLAGGGARRADGPVPVTVLAERMERVSPRPGRDRVRDLDRATKEGGIFSWIGTRERLISTSVADRRVLILHLEKICRAERQRGLIGHWTYDLSRHTQINALLAVETAELEAMVGGAA